MLTENTKKINTLPIKWLWGIENGKPNGPMGNIFPTLKLKKASMEPMAVQNKQRNL